MKPHPTLRNETQALTTNGESRPTMRWETKEPQRCPKRESDWRMMVININKFPTESSGQEKAKMDLLKQTMTGSEADVIGITELGRNENNLQLHNRPSNIVKKWFDKGIAQSAWNSRNNHSIFEPGGVLTVTRDKSSAHTIRRGKDEKNLGRWVWVTVKGKHNRQTTIITTNQ